MPMVGCRSGGVFFSPSTRPSRRPGKLSKPCKAQAKFKGENDTGHDPNSEAHCEDAKPEAIDLQIQRIPGPEPEAFYDSEEHGKPNGHRRENNVKAHRKRKLNSGENGRTSAKVSRSGPLI